MFVETGSGGWYGIATDFIQGKPGQPGLTWIKFEITPQRTDVITHFVYNLASCSSLPHFIMSFAIDFTSEYHPLNLQHIPP